MSLPLQNNMSRWNQMVADTVLGMGPPKEPLWSDQSEHHQLSDQSAASPSVVAMPEDAWPASPSTPTTNICGRATKESPAGREENFWDDAEKMAAAMVVES